MKHLIGAALVTAGAFLSPAALARDVTVEVTNITNGIWFTPLLVAFHDERTDLFELAQPASPALQAMAEGGDTGGLAAQVEAGGGIVVPAGGLVPPGASVTATVTLPPRALHSLLSITGMLLPTNDGFVALDSLPVPRAHGSYELFLRGYDAGTEANDEIITGGGAPGAPGIPGDPGGHGGVGATGAAGADANGTVHVHRGILGDDDPAGGVSDLDRSVHRFSNPVARVVITVGR